MIPTTVKVIFLNPSSLLPSATFFHKLLLLNIPHQKQRIWKLLIAVLRGFLSSLWLIIIPWHYKCSSSKSSCGGEECLVSCLTIAGGPTFCCSWCKSKLSLISPHKWKEYFLNMPGSNILEMVLDFHLHFWSSKVPCLRNQWQIYTFYISVLASATPQIL